MGPLLHSSATEAPLVGPPPPVALTTSALAAQLPGRLSEVGRSAAGGQSSLAAALVVAAQRRGQATAWVQASEGPLFPPDLAAAGVDVAALAVLHVGGPREPALRLRAAEWLLMGGGFGLVVVDLNDGVPRGLGWQGRLLPLVRRYRSSVVLLTAQPAAASSLGPLVSLRLWPEPCEAGPPAAFDLSISLLKNKAALPPGPALLPCCGPLELQR